MLDTYTYPYHGICMLDASFRVQVYEILMAIHELGLKHNDLSLRNIVVDDLADPKRVTIIDFENATIHECKRDMHVFLYQVPPPPDEFGCEELYAIAKQLLIWTPGTWFTKCSCVMTN